MITDAIISFFQQIVGFIYNLIPTAAVVAAGNGAASGTACCATFIIVGFNSLFSTPITIGSNTVSLLSGGVAALANSPLAVIMDWQFLMFGVGCMLSILAAVFIIKILVYFWMLVKW